MYKKNDNVYNENLGKQGPVSAILTISSTEMVSQNKEFL